jgi:hypothetical protein
VNATQEVAVSHVVGTGDPLDMLLLIPLIVQWGVPRACETELDEGTCEVPIRRIVILAEPGFTDGAGSVFRELGYCETHYQSFIARSKPATKET